MNIWKVTKEIVYKCGCTVTITENCKREATFKCELHNQNIKKVITTEFWD